MYSTYTKPVVFYMCTLAWRCYVSFFLKKKNAVGEDDFENHRRLSHSYVYIAVYDSKEQVKNSHPPYISFSKSFKSRSYDSPLPPSLPHHTLPSLPGPNQPLPPRYPSNRLIPRPLPLPTTLLHRGISSQPSIDLGHCIFRDLEEQLNHFYACGSKEGR